MRTISISISRPKSNDTPPAEAKKPTRPPNSPVLFDAAGCPDPVPDQVPFSARPLSSGVPDESDALASVVCLPPPVLPAPVPVLVRPDPLPPEPDPFGLVDVQNSVWVVCPAGSVGCGFSDCETQAGPWLGVSANAGAAVWIAASATIGAAPRAATNAINLRIRHLQKGMARR